jgi:hypothetical protein
MAFAGSTPNTINTKAPDMTLNMPTAFLLLADGLIRNSARLPNRKTVSTSLQSSAA